MAKNDDINVDVRNLDRVYPLEKETQNIKINIVNTKNNTPARVFIGEYIDREIKDKSILFLSSKRAMRVYIQDNDYMQFRDGKYNTNDPEMIGVLREVAKKHEIFEGRFPKWYLDKLQEEEKNTYQEPFET